MSKGANNSLLNPNSNTSNGLNCENLEMDTFWMALKI